MAEKGGVSQTAAMANLTKRIQAALKGQQKSTRMKKQKNSRKGGDSDDDDMTDDSDLSVDLSDYDSESD